MRTRVIALLLLLPLGTVLMMAACDPLDLGGAADLAIAPDDAALSGTDASPASDDASAIPPDLAAPRDLALHDLRRPPDLAVESDLTCGAHLVAAPAMIHLGKVPAGQPSTPVVLSLTNDSNCELQLLSAKLTGPDSAAFQFDPLKLPWPLPAGQSYAVGVWLMAPAGSYTAALDIGTDIVAQPKVTVSLDGTAVKGSPRIMVDVAQLSFGSQPVGAQSALRPINISNTGPADLHLLGLALGGAMPGDFLLDTTMVKRALPMGASTTVSIAFRPLALGARGANLAIGSDDPLTPALLIPVDGVGK